MSNSENTTEWFQLPDDPYFRGPRGTMIRSWQAGDGLACSHRNMRSSVPCGAPAAVVSSGDPSMRARRTSVVCTIHAADVVRQLVREQRSVVNLKTEAQRIAKEQVIAAHWGEYQDAIAEAIDAESVRAFAWLPESLRELILSAEAASTKECTNA